MEAADAADASSVGVTRQTLDEFRRSDRTAQPGLVSSAEFDRCQAMKKRMLFTAPLILAPMLVTPAAHATGEGVLTISPRAQNVCVNLTRDIKTIDLPHGYRASIHRQKNCRGHVLLESTDRRITGLPGGAASVHVFKESSGIRLPLVHNLVGDSAAGSV
ncbi:hypothetical protein [Streptomyces sp. WM6378]|uniref:hypothetical protein n=1 Tax=Streptomyces sp. WM6378 TaxID=1415557 RepID=UPI00131CEA8B|nr:hypothetical protein [Streptomyces sp. WM6378]